ncbi:TIGR03643 family protein [Pleomorphovibrio marinus]|uniref:TIGR03643 family protein n=1 Tax=Pleomorphovibrio marinus TaxID=2164132 RepID=UPI000E0AD8B8|nr:TIGR03643 family protein [Pleomorphovibrio marinus]
MARLPTLTEEEKDRIIEMAWEDRTPFDAIYEQFDLPEKKVILLMRRELKKGSFNLWRKRVQGRATKHIEKSPKKLSRFRSSRQKSISGNKVSKR